MYTLVPGMAKISLIRWPTMQLNDWSQEGEKRTREINITKMAEISSRRQGIQLGNNIRAQPHMQMHRAASWAKCFRKK
jgi:hypothetical protein